MPEIGSDGPSAQPVMEDRLRPASHVALSGLARFTRSSKRRWTDVRSGRRAG